jgi:hypothetical protein
MAKVLRVLDSLAWVGPAYAAAIRYTRDLIARCAMGNTALVADTIETFEKLIDQLQLLRLHLDNGGATIALVRASRVGFVRGDASDRAGVAYDLTYRVLKPLLDAQPTVAGKVDSGVKPEVVQQPRSA